MTDRSDSPGSHAVAIIGMAGRFPKANSVAEFWRLLRDGREGIHFFSKEELVHDGIMASLLEHPAYVPAKGFLEESESFESELFGYHPRDAQVIDPQQRLLLESCWEALEDAGCDPARYEGSIGVFTGVSMNSWLHQLFKDPEVVDNVGSYQLMISNDKDYAPTRVSYQLNLRGPSIAIQTACSTSLVAVAQACQSVASGECDMALAGAASLAFPRKSGYLYEEGMILSPDGHCRPFDARAQGTVPGEGVAVVALKRLEDALADGDHIEAVIRGWAVNNDGSNKVGYTAPSVAGQAEVIAAAQKFAGVSADSIGYIEAHGTATPLGDPIEVAALCDAFRSQTKRTGFCRIGSVKSNLGHLDTTAGLAGLIKTVLALKHREIPASLHYESPNPEIDFERSPFIVNDRLTPWESGGRPRRAGVSSFGIGGTNCHLILEEAPSHVASPASSAPQLLVYSGASPNAAAELQHRLANSLDVTQHSLADVAFTLQVGRAELRHRRALVCDDIPTAVANLRSQGGSQLVSGESRDAPPSIVFLIPGQGSQFVGMGRGLYDEYETFREEYDRCASILLDTVGWDLRDRVFADSHAVASAQLDDTATAQPALFATCYALSRLLAQCGIEPTAMIGHSVSEYVAACLAGVMTLEDALRIVAKRGELMQRTKPGAMLAIGWTAEDAIESWLKDRCDIAALNAPGAIVISGKKQTISELQLELDKQQISSRLLRTSHAFHSSLMKPILEEFSEFLSRFRLQPPSIPFVSTVTGTWITAAEATDPDYWTTAIRRTVRFQDAILCVSAEPDRKVLLEVGPGRVLQTLSRQTLGTGAESPVVSTMRSQDSDRNDAWSLCEAVGKLWTNGVPIAWEALHGTARRQRVSLPSYPFQRREYSVSRASQPHRLATRTSQIDKQPLARWFYSPSWKREELVGDATPESRAIESWLLFCDDCGIAREIGSRLQRAGHVVSYVQPGDAFQQLGPNEFVIDPKLYGSYSRLLNTVSTIDRRVKRVLHCWALAGASDVRFDSMQHLGFYSLLFLSQALGRHAITDSVRIDVVTSETQDVLGVEPLCPAKATVRAPILVVPQEYPHILCQHLDVNVREFDSASGWLVEAIFQELTYENPGCEAALRGRSRWVRSFEPLLLGNAKPPADDNAGAWLVIGGLGQIGLTIAGWITHAKQAPVILVGRSELPAADEWESWLHDRDADDPTSRRLVAIKQLNESGVKVTVASADVADESALRHIARLAVEQHGSIGGIVHSAGVVDSRIIHYTSPADCERQFRAKVAGIEAVANIAREFCVPKCLVNSSLSSILGGLGFCGYTASNLYLDSFLRQQNRLGTTSWVGVNWDGWLFADAAEAMQGDPAVRLTLTPDEGFECLDYIDRTKGLQQVVVSTGDIDARLNAWVRREQIEEAHQADDDQKSRARHPRPGNLSSLYAVPTGEVEKTIAAVWEELLGIEQIGVNDNYIELGGHSLLAGQIISRIRDQLETPISIRSLFEFPSVAQLAMHVEAVRLTFDDGQDGEVDENYVEVEF